MKPVLPILLLAACAIGCTDRAAPPATPAAAEAAPAAPVPAMPVPATPDPGTGGSLRVESNGPGTGATFILCLPALTAELTMGEAA